MKAFLLGLFCFSELAGAASELREFVVEAGGEKLPQSLRYAPGAMAKVEIRSSRPMAVKWECGYPKVATAWHLGGGIWMSLGSEIAQSSVAGPCPYSKTTTGKFYAGFGVGPTSAPRVFREEMFEMYLVGTVKRLVPVAQDFHWEVVDREAEIWMAEFDPRRSTGDYAIFRVRDLEAPAKIALSDGEEELGVGDEVIVLGYPGNNRFGMPLRSNNLYAIRARIEKLSKSTFIVLDRSLDSGFEGAVVLHANSGRAIGMISFSLEHGARSEGISSPSISSVAIDIRSLRLNRKLEEILPSHCVSLVENP